MTTTTYREFYNAVKRRQMDAGYGKRERARAYMDVLYEVNRDLARAVERHDVDTIRRIADDENTTTHRATTRAIRRGVLINPTPNLNRRVPKFLTFCRENWKGAPAPAPARPRRRILDEQLTDWEQALLTPRDYAMAA